MTQATTRLIKTDELKQAINGALPISEVALKLGVDLEAAGNQLKGLCPLHDEATPSFYLNDLKGVYHCFGCKAGGDSIDLLRELQHVEYHEALEQLAEWAGVDIELYRRAMTAEEQHRAGLQDWLDQWVDNWNAAYLTKIAMGDAEVQRMANPQVAKELRLGWSGGPMPAEATLAWEQYAPDLKRNELFVDRVIFPMLNHRGRPVGWKARDPHSKEMYGVSHKFPLYQPTLFGLHVAREHVADYGELVVVEGEWDTAVCHEHGHANVAGLGGSSFTDGHLELIQQLHIQQITFLFDGDDGGWAAARALAKKYWSAPVRIRIQVLQPGWDPDAVLQVLGMEALQHEIAQARHGLEFLLWDEWNARPRESLGAKLDFVQWIRDSYGEHLRATDEALVLQAVAGWMNLSTIDVQDFVRTEISTLHAIDSERVVLSKAVRSQPYYLELRKLLAADDFHLVKHQRIYEVLLSVLADGLDWDQTVIRQRCENQGVLPEYLIDLITVPETNLNWHEDQVADMALRRWARDDSLRFKSQIADPLIPADRVIGQFTQAVTERVLRKDGGAMRELVEQVDTAMDVLHQRMKNPSAIHGLDLGVQFPNLSQTLQGLQQRRFVLLYASSGVGKSTSALQWSLGLAVSQAVPVDFISLEMDESEILFKLASHMTGINGMAITGGALTDTEAKTVEQAMARIRNSPLRIYAPDDMCPTDFLIYAREAVMQRRTQLFVLDYAQLLSPDPGTEREGTYTNLGDFGRMAKMKVARALDTTVLCVAQLRREAASKERPTKEDAGDSYAIVRHADVILILSEPESGETMELWVDKNRQGTGNVLIPLVFKRKEQTLYEAHGGQSAPNYRLKV